MTDQVQENPNLPDQARKQADQARQVIEDWHKAQEGEGGDPGQEPQQPQEPQEPQQPQEPQEPVSPPQDPEDPNYWKHRFEVLQGKYNNEVPQLQQEIRQRDYTLENLQNRLSKLEQPSEPQEPQQPQPSITDDEVQDFGPELTDFIRRVAKDELLPQLQSEIKKLSSSVEQASQTAAQTAQQKVFDYLDKNVPEWQEMNTDAGFLNWLKEVEPLTGRPRKESLDDAFEKNDASRVAAFFTIYRDTHQPQQPQQPQEPQQPQQPQEPQQPQQPTAEDFVSPGGNSRGSPPRDPNDPSSKKIWPKTEIERFFRDSAQGMYKGQEQEADKKRAEITKAAAEGRVDPNK